MLIAFSLIHSGVTGFGNLYFPGTVFKTTDGFDHHLVSTRLGIMVIELDMRGTLVVIRGVL